MGKARVLEIRLVLSILLVIVATAQGQQPAWQTNWDRTLAAAKREGQLVYHSGSQSEAVFREFQKKFPEIKATKIVTRGGGATLQRLISERRAGVYSADVVTIGGTSGVKMAEAGVFDPIEPALILPEILDRSNWWQRKYHYADGEGKYLLTYSIVPQPDTGYNTKLVNPASLKSYWDFLDPKWKGRIIILDPADSGAGSSLRLRYYHPNLGPNYLKRLFTEMDLVASRDGRQIVDWLANGKYAISLFTPAGRTGLDTARAQGLPINWFPPEHFKEGVPFTTMANNLALINRAPHLNAAKLFINWFLSREGQLIAQKVAVEGNEGIDSLRIDIPKDDVPPDSRLKEGVKYFYTDRVEWMDMIPIQKSINEWWKSK